MSIVSLRLRPEQKAKIDSLFKQEKTKLSGAKISDFIRELIDIGIAYKFSKLNNKAGEQSPLTSIEEEMFAMLYQLVYTQNAMVTNSFIEGKTKFNTPKDLVVESVNLSKNKVSQLIEKLVTT